MMFSIEIWKLCIFMLNKHTKLNYTIFEFMIELSIYRLCQNTNILLLNTPPFHISIPKNLCNVKLFSVVYLPINDLHLEWINSLYIFNLTSFPSPDSLTPPNGASGELTIASLIPTIPTSNLFPTRQHWL